MPIRSGQLRILVRAVAMLLTAVGATTQARAAEEVNYLLPAPSSLPAFAPWVIAKQLGYYKDAGYDVTFITGKGGIDVAKQVGAGNAPLGVAQGDSPVFVRGNGVPVKTIAVIGGGALSVIVARGDRNIHDFKDLRGKKINVMSYQEASYYALQGILARNGIGKEDVSVQAVGPGGVVPLVVAGSADACVCTPDWEVDVRNALPDAVSLPTFGNFPTMAQAIIASDETIAKRPELLRALVKATLRGMEYVINDPAAGAKAYAEATPSFVGKEAWLTQVLTNYRDRTYKGQSVPGAMDVEKLKAAQDYYAQQKIIQTTFPLDDLYTNAFVK